jgi:hypothetical protein
VFVLNLRQSYREKQLSVNFAVAIVIAALHFVGFGF